MPLNKNALGRIRIIDECLHQRHRQWGWEQLSQICWEKLAEFIQDAPSRETIMGDIRFMRDQLYAPIIYDRKVKTFYYDDPSYSVFNHPLTTDDVGELQFALEVIRQFKGFKKLEGIESIITKLDHLLSLVDIRSTPIVLFEHSLNDTGQRWLDILFSYIRDKRAIRMTYQPFTESQASEMVVSPYLLKEFNNRWFFLGFDHSMQVLQIYALDRIVNIEKELVSFIVNKVLDPISYFSDIIGVTKLINQKKVRIKFSVIKDQSPYVQTKPIHESQKLINQTHEYDIYQIEVIPNVELEGRLLAFGEWLTVLSPSKVRNQIMTRIKKMKASYANTIS